MSHEVKPVYPAKGGDDGALEAYKKEHLESVSNTSDYWSKEATSNLDWFHPFTTPFTGTFEKGDVAFFLNGKLNACYNCVDRHIANGRGDKTAILWEGDDPSHTARITYNEVLPEVCKIANALKDGGVRKGDVVTIYMPMIPQLAYVMLACARIGAVHSVVFGGFSAEAIAERARLSHSRFVVTSNMGLRGKRSLPLKKIVDSALKHEKMEGATVDKVFVFRHYATEENVTVDSYLTPGRDVDMDAYVAHQRPYCPCEWMDSEDNLFILYTSGSTGKPKGLLHTTAGYCLYAKLTTKRSFDLNPDTDVFACVADCGWITGHSYIVYGPLLNGASTFMFESTPMCPDPGRYWDMVQRHKISIFYTAPTAIRTLMRFGEEHVKKYDKSSLRVLGTVGEPINPEAWRWYYEVVGEERCSIVDTYWQTETGGHVITNLPGVTPMKPGSCTLPFFGILPVVLDAQTGKELGQAGEASDEEISGVLAIKVPWPGMARTCLGDHERYLSVYTKPYPGYYFTGDGCRRDKDGFIWVTGRVDDVLNVSGHRIGTAEVESALVGHPAVAQAAVVGFPHDIKGTGICVYTTLTVEYSGDEYINDTESEKYKSLISELRNAVRSGIGPFATPDIIVPSPSLPMTRSGKIMRRILRKIASGELENLGDTTTLADPSVVDSLIERMAKLRS